MNIMEIVHPSTGEVLHRIAKGSLSDFPGGNSAVMRTDLSEEAMFLQAALIQIPAEHSFRAHRHLERSRTFSNLKAQESWVVLRGEVYVSFFTNEGEFLAEEKLEAGDLSITFSGGHSYRTDGKESLVYEFKSGPYEGQTVDKVFLDGGLG